MYQMWHRWQTTRWRSWLNKRIPPAKSITLKHNHIFILPSKFGVTILLTIVAMYILGINYQNNLIIFSCYLLLSVFLITLFTSYIGFAGIRLQQIKRPINASNQSGVISIQITKAPPTGAIMCACWSNDKHLVSTQLVTEDSSITLPIERRKRGCYSLPRVKCFSRFPLGLFTCWTYLDFAAEQIVYPAPIATRMRLDTDTSSDIANHNILSPGGDEFDSLRQYRIGDSLKQVHWKHAAKSGQWTTKTFQQAQARPVYLKLDKACDFETALGKLVFQVIDMHEQQREYGLIINTSVIPPALGSQHFEACLTAIAKA